MEKRSHSQQKFTSPSARNSKLYQKEISQQANVGFRSGSWNEHDRLYLMQQKSERHRYEISRLRKAIDVRKSMLLHKKHITRRNKALEENLLNVYETTTESVTSLFGLIHKVYNSLRHVDDDKALDKTNNEANNAIQEILELCKKIDDLKKQDGFPWNISDNTGNQDNRDSKSNDENDMEIDISNDIDDNMVTSIDLKTLLEQYNKTESLVDELANDLEQLKNYNDEMILWKDSHLKKSSTDSLQLASLNTSTNLYQIETGEAKQSEENKM